MALKVAINGFGRIGRQILHIAINNPELEFVAVNDLTDAKTLAHLFKYDSVHRKFHGTVEVDGDAIVINGKRIKVIAEKDPAKLPWKEMGVDIVIESTGFFTDGAKAKAHLDAGAKKVLISAPATNEDLTIVLGVNDEKYNPDQHHVISNASCTTNCLAPVVKVLNDRFGIVKGLMTTIHSYTSDQRLLDAPHKDLRRARAAALSIVPTTTGVNKAIAVVLPELAGKLSGFALRVPTPNVSVVDLAIELAKDVTVEDVNNAFRSVADKDSLTGILAVSDDPLVSTDFMTNSYSSTVDAELTLVQDKRLVKVVSWYDNEWGYSARMVDLCLFVGKKALVTA